ncbi:MAG: HNH nuclease family protein [Desulfurivibrio sp.]|jgi:5-methylcytosine-specific restriction endonuclease McrA|nr:MAG: HNH nuclease family protein [Desulfurivibrio sp.]
MTEKKSSTGNDKVEQLVAEARRSLEQREKTYRERALKLFPWICARCGREFSGRKLKDLTVHHKDHNHDNNPADGSNWELLCLYCHDNEHSRNAVAASYSELKPGDGQQSFSSHSPFAGLQDLLKNKK